MNYNFIHSKKLVLKPFESNWASEMVLNPAIIKDKKSSRIHMLFRATGPWEKKRAEGKPVPYPIFLGYGWSDDNGESWQFDTNRPAISPKVEMDIDKILIRNYKGEMVVNYSNGCIEDPRLFYFEDQCYVITACRMFPPGPYWIKDEPTQCAPEWISTRNNPYGKAASENVTVNVLFKVDLDCLASGNYDKAFTYVTNLTDACFGEDRDVLIFPERLMIDGQPKIVMLQRPFNPSAYPGINEELPPSIVICAADKFEDFSNPGLTRYVLAVPKFQWEKDRIGGSTPPVKIGEDEWLLNYHGKQDAEIGYTQSFMILKEQKSGMPSVTHRCPERLAIADQDWEMPNKFKTPCIFMTGLIELGEELLASYGAADEKIGVLKINKAGLINYIKKFKA